MVAMVTIKDELNPLIEMMFPITPSALPESASADVKSYRVIGAGTHSFPDGRTERNFDITGYFPGTGRARARLPHILIDQWRHPQSLADRLRLWMETKTRLRYENDTIAGQQSISVYLSSYTFTKQGSAGDIGYSLKLVEWRRIKIKVDDGTDTSNTGAVGQDSTTSSGEDQSEEPNPQTYTVVSGDNLSFIAKRFLGDAGRWNEIFEANRETIGDNPNLIQPGMELIIPGGTLTSEDTSGYEPSGIEASQEDEG